MPEITTIQHREEQLINMLHTKDEAVIDHIYQYYSHNLFNVILRIVKQEGIAQDVFQEAMVKIWKNGPTYNRSKGSLYTWLLTICRNAAIDKTRSKEFKRQEKTEKEPYIVDREVSIVQAVDHELSHVKEWVAKLPEAKRQLIEMSFFQGYTHEEIAKQLNIPLGTVKTRIRSAIKLLRKHL